MEGRELKLQGGWRSCFLWCGRYRECGGLRMEVVGGKGRWEGGLEDIYNVEVMVMKVLKEQNRWMPWYDGC